MNLLDTICLFGLFWCICFWIQYRRVKRAGQVTPKMQAPQPWPNPPELSCFVRGLIKSMRETPGEWELTLGVSTPSYWSHTQTGMSLYRVAPSKVLHVGGQIVSQSERDAVVMALNTYLEAPHNERINRLNAETRATREVRLAAQRATFEKLACPEVSDNPSR